MKVEFNAGKELWQYSQEVSRKKKKLIAQFRDNARIAADKALEEVKKNTPHLGDGKPRGKNVITNALMKAWKVKVEFPNSNNKDSNFTVISFLNRKKYSDYVQFGHKMTPHFVPWLYKDGDVISRENTHAVKVFGLMVGTKTPFVKGIDMVGTGIKRFQDCFKEMCEQSFQIVWSRK